MPDWFPDISDSPASTATTPASAPTGQKDWFPDISDAPTSTATAAPPAQKDWFPDIKEKPYESPYKGRVANLESLPKNLASDIGQFGQGLAALGALPIARGYEVSQGQPLLRKTDLPELGQAAKGIVDYYVNEYGKPYIEANKAQSFPEMLGKETSNLGEHFMKAPLATALDLLPEKALMGPVTGKLAEATNKLKKTFPVMPRWMEHPFLPQWMKHLHASNEVEKLVSAKLLEAEQSMKDKMFAAKRTMDEAFEAVPNEMKPYLLAAGEITNPLVHKKIANHPAVQNLLGHVENYNQQMEKILNIPEPINRRTRYGGMLMQRLEAARQAKLQRLAEEYRSGKLPHRAIENPIKFNPNELPSTNYLAPLSTYTDILYRETSVDKALELLGGVRTNLLNEHIYFANTPELALGQGANKGVLLKLNSKDLRGSLNLEKPTAELSYKQGQIELVGKHNEQSKYVNAVTEVTIEPSAQATSSDMKVLRLALRDRGLTEVRTNLNGSVTYTRTGAIGKRIPASLLRKEAILAEIRDLKPLKFEDLKQPKYMKLLGQLKAGWEKEHAPPIYAAIANAVAVKRGLAKLINEPLAKKGGMSALAKQMAQEGLESAFEASPQNMPGWMSKGRLQARILKTRPALTPLGKAVTNHVLTIRGAEASHNIKDLTLLRLFESYRLQGLLDYMNKLKEMSTKKRPGWIKVNLNDEFKKLVAQTPAAMMPKLEGKAEIWLPKKVADTLLESLHGNAGNQQLWNKLHFYTNLRNQFAYLLNPVFAAKLAIQTGAIEMFSWKTPKDIFYSTAGHIIAAHPEAKDILPNAYILSHDVHMPIDLLMSGLSFQKAWAIAKDIGGRISYGPQDYIRRANAISFLLKNASGAGMPIRNLIKSALDVSTTIKLIEEQTYNVNLTKQLQAHIKKYFGDYSNIASNQMWRQVAKLFFSVPAWLAHTANSVKALPLEHPIKTALLAQLGRIAQKELQPINEPEAFKKMGLIPIKDKQGNTKYVGGLDLVVFHGGLEMIEALTNLVFNPGGEVNIPSGLAPVPATLVEGAMKFDVRSHKPFVEENPELRHPKRRRLRGTRIHTTTVTGKWINPETGEEVKQIAPPVELLAIENEFPNIMKPIQYAVARKDGKFYTPSRFTFPGHPARKTFYREPIEESNEQAVLNLLGIPVK